LSFVETFVKKNDIKLKLVSTIPHRVRETKGKKISYQPKKPI